MSEKALEQDHHFMQLAIEQAEQSLQQNGIPIGSVLVIENQVVGQGHNQRIQKGNPILHGEMDCLQNAGRLQPDDYQRSTLYTTLSPCPMCSGAILLYKIPRVVIAENSNFLGQEDLLQAAGVELIVLNHDKAIQMMKTYIQQHPDIWFEDISTPIA